MAGDPTTLDEYNERYQANTRITGFGVDVATIFPCPGCTAPDWLRFPVTAALNDYADVQEPTTCSACGRTFRFAVEVGDGNVRGGIVQTAGDPIPSYLPPMR